MKDFMFVALMRLSRMFLIICGAFMWVSKVFERRAYSFRPKLCLEDGICLNNSLIPYYKKNKMGQKLVEFATNSLIQKAGEVTMHGKLWTDQSEPVTFPMTLENVKAEEMVYQASTPVKKTFYNLKEDEYDRRAQEMIDRKVEELNKEAGSV